MDTACDLQILVCSGPEQIQRAVLGFASALAAASSGSNVILALSMHGAHWAAASEGHEVGVPGFPPIAELIVHLAEAGARLQACTTCIENYCPSAVGPDGLKVLRPPFERVGLGIIAMRMASARTVLF